MIEIHAPNDFRNHNCRSSIFLAGSVEMNNAKHWQRDFIEEMKSFDLACINPRRPDWDSSQEPNLENDYFNAQVVWEMSALMSVDHIFMYFDPETKSPISLMELGFLAATCPSQVLVVCPYGFWRKGNVEFICNHYNIKTMETFEKAVTFYKNKWQFLAMLK